jgi:hypothetical protein
MARQAGCPPSKCKAGRQPGRHELFLVEIAHLATDRATHFFLWASLKATCSRDGRRERADGAEEEDDGVRSPRFNLP